MGVKQQNRGWLRQMLASMMGSEQDGRTIGYMPLDDLMPRWHFRERHSRARSAPVPALLAAAEQVTWAEVPVMQALMGIRSAGGSRPPRIAEQADPAAFFAHFTAPGWAKMALDFRATGAELTTETRVWLTDEVPRRRFPPVLAGHPAVQWPDPSPVAGGHRPSRE